MGLGKLAKALRKRQETLRRLTRVAEQQSRIEWLKAGPKRGVRRAASLPMSTTHPPPIPHPSGTGAPGAVEHPSETTRPVPSYRDGWDGCSPGGPDGTSLEGPAVPNGWDGTDKTVGR
jgi:hypothetical protein